MPHPSLQRLPTRAPIPVAGCDRRMLTGAWEPVIEVTVGIAASAKPVTLARGSDRTDAANLPANLEAEQLSLAPDVHSTYVLSPN